MIDRDAAGSPEERNDLMRQALTCDTFLMSTNALSMDGQLVNIDGNGNRVAAMIYGPKSVIVIAGMNKTASTVESAWVRARNTARRRYEYSARFDIKTPCTVTGQCGDCKSEDCVCAYIWSPREFAVRRKRSKSFS